VDEESACREYSYSWDVVSACRASTITPKAKPCREGKGRDKRGKHNVPCINVPNTQKVPNLSKVPKFQISSQSVKIYTVLTPTLLSLSNTKNLKVQENNYLQQFQEQTVTLGTCH
jgi:hypothetical protein